MLIFACRVVRSELDSAELLVTRAVAVNVLPV
jgi:hypothetical protein